MCPDPEPAAGAPDAAAAQPATPADQDAAEPSPAAGRGSSTTPRQEPVYHCPANISPDHKDEAANHQPTGKSLLAQSLVGWDLMITI